MKLTGAAILVSRGMKVLQAAPAAYPYRSASEGKRVDEVERHIAAYRSAPFDAAGEAWAKTAALEALEEFLPDGRVLDFFLAVVADSSEYDMARLHLLKLFEVDPAPAARQLIGECVAAALPGEEDWTVRCWLGRAVAAFADIPAARAVAIARALDPAEDEDVRHNCLAGLRPSDPEVVPALRQLAAEDSLLGHTARERLARAADAEPGAADECQSPNT
jgi:hypothetical protein